MPALNHLCSVTAASKGRFSQLPLGTSVPFVPSRSGAMQMALAFVDSQLLCFYVWATVSLE